MKIETQLKNIEQQFNVTITEATPEHHKVWAKTLLMKRCTYNPDIVFELNENKQIYILERVRATSLHLKGVCEHPSKELITFIETWAQ